MLPLCNLGVFLYTLCFHSSYFAELREMHYQHQINLPVVTLSKVR